MSLSQDSAAYKKTAEAATVAKEKTATMWASVTSSSIFQSTSGGGGSRSFKNDRLKKNPFSGKVGSAFGAAKARVSSSMSHQNIAGEQAAAGGAAAPAAGAPADGTNGTAADAKQ